MARLLTYTPETVKSDLDAELTWLAGDFARDFEHLTNDRIITVASEAKVSQEAVVDEVGVENSGSDETSSAKASCRRRVCPAGAVTTPPARAFRRFDLSAKCRRTAVPSRVEMGRDVW